MAMLPTLSKCVMTKYLGMRQLQAISYFWKVLKRVGTGERIYLAAAKPLNDDCRHSCKSAYILDASKKVGNCTVCQAKRRLHSTRRRYLLSESIYTKEELCSTANRSLLQNGAEPKLF